MTDPLEVQPTRAPRMTTERMRELFAEFDATTEPGTGNAPSRQLAELGVLMCFENSSGACTVTPVQRYATGVATGLFGRILRVESSWRSSFALAKAGSKMAVPKLLELAAKDHTMLPGWWTVAEEAADALLRMEGKEPPDPPILK